MTDTFNKLRGIKPVNQTPYGATSSGSRQSETEYSLGPRELTEHYLKEGAKQPKKCTHNVADFANLLKAFIGTNYLALAFGIRQSGLGLGIVGLVLVATMTAHCCHLIVVLKYHAIERVLSRRLAMNYGRSAGALPRRSLTSQDGGGDEDDDTEGDSDDDDGANTADEKSALYKSSFSESVRGERALFKRLQRKMTYADLGYMAFGKWGGRMVTIFLVFTQVGFCIAYHIFIGSNMYTLLRSCSPVSTNDSLQQALSVYANGHLHAGNGTDPPGCQPPVSWVPPLQLLVVLPLPIFIFFTLFRSVRLMAPISVMANGLVTLGYVLVMIYIISTFKLRDDLVWFKWATFPVFLGQAAGSYEAIGTILSIEASMEGNHHRYPACLVGVVVVFSAMLTASALVGYMAYGENTQQILVQNLPPGTALTIVINVMLIVAIVCTYPLQVFPIIDAIEVALFSEGKLFGPPPSTLVSQSYSSTAFLVDNLQSTANESSYDPHGNLAKEIPPSVATWKRNLVRMLIAFFMAGMAVLLKDVFAYVNAFVGALGSSPLAFILPCLFHLKMKGKELPRLIIVKDVIIIILGFVIGVVGLVVVIMEVIQRLT